MSNRISFRDVARKQWNFADDASCEVISTCALLDIAESLRAIREDIKSLGYDGLHEVLRYFKKRARRSESLTCAKRRAARAKRKAARS